MNRRGLLAATIGYLAMAVVLAVFVLALRAHESEMLYLFLTLATAVPPTLALLGSMPRFERHSAALLRIAAGLFAFFGLLLVPLLAAAVLCLAATSQTITPAVVGLFVVGTLCVVSAGLSGVPLDDDYCGTTDLAREATSIESGLGWWPPGFRCTYTSNRTGARTVHAVGGYWPLGLGAVAVASFGAGGLLWAGARRRPS